MSQQRFNIVQFQAASGLPLTADFIVNTLGIAADEQQKRALFWNRDKYGLIIGRLQNFINSKGAANPCDMNGQRPKKDDAPPATADAGGDFFGDEEAAPAEANEEFF